jgi:hypothetical protein
MGERPTHDSALTKHPTLRELRRNAVMALLVIVVVLAGSCVVAILMH